jgi:tol-pal system protein YbgF
MQTFTGEKSMKRIAYLFIIGLLGVASTAQAGVKEELIRLQADVLALKNQISLLDKTFTERTDSIRSLVTQLNDQVGRTSLVLGKISNVMETQSSSDTTIQQSLLQEIKHLSAKMDDANTRISALAQQIADMKVQSKPIVPRLYQSAGNNPDALALSADQIFSEAYNDLVQGNVDMAIEGFTAFLRNFPTNERADDAQYYIGEAYYNGRKNPEAISAFQKVVTDYASGSKVASALYKMGKAKVAAKQGDSAIADFTTLIQKYPTATEAGLARAELERLGIDPAKLVKPAVKKKSAF